jgi:hypothetical protein
MAFLAGLISCSKVQDAAVKAVYEQMTSLTNDLADKITNSADDKEAAAAIVAYSEGMQQISDSVKALNEKYPDLKNSTVYKAQQEKLTEAFSKMTKAMISLGQKYPDSKEIKDAMAKTQSLGSEE